MLWHNCCFPKPVRQRNSTDRGRPKYSDEDPSHRHFAHHKSHMNWLETHNSAIQIKSLVTMYAVAQLLLPQARLLFNCCYISLKDV